VLNPVSVNVTTYTPGRKSTMRYWPFASVSAVRTFSISTSLLASTVTPGSTAPEVSLTTPAIEDWAYAEDDARRNPKVTRINGDLRMSRLLVPCRRAVARIGEPFGLPCFTFAAMEWAGYTPGNREGQTGMVLARSGLTLA
jgi:hypothetical protein